MTRWTTLCIVACFLLVSGSDAATDLRTRECVRCHPAAGRVLEGPMARRSGERAFAHRAFGRDEGDAFFEQACSGCHVRGCADCHGAGSHPSTRPGNAACLRCHRGYSAGWEYEGKAPREDHARYQRGRTSQNEPYLSMLPDIHFEHGLLCADCHGMESMHVGGAAKGCRDCHAEPDRSVPEHAIAAHLEKMRCEACHAAWAAQEYGTQLVRPRDAAEAELFSPLRQWGPWRKSAALKRQDAPPLGLDGSGLVAPIRPQFVLLVTDKNAGRENRLLAAEWRAFMPHTIRRGTVTCGGCHDDARRFLLEASDDRIYLPDLDGVPLSSWWNRDGQTVVNGSFFPAGRFLAMNTKTPEFNQMVVRQWQRILVRDARR